MDPFTQRILERAEQRSKALGISNTTKFSEIKENVQNIEVPSKKLQLVERVDTVKKTLNSPSKIRRHYSVDKENVDVGIEINITTGSNVDVQVEVEEQELKSDGTPENSTEAFASHSGSVIRDTSRTRLQRLGVLYSNKDISSPIHRTEGKFHEEETSSSGASCSSRSKQKLCKLAALADSIKSWEDDTSHPDYKHSKLDEKVISSPACSEDKRIQAEVHYSPRSAPSTSDKDEQTHIQGEQIPKAKVLESKLKWDKTVLDSLEAQGFQRRQSKNTHFSYDYNNGKSKVAEVKEKQGEKLLVIEKEKTTKQVTKQPVMEKEKVTREEPKFISIKSGLVSNRTAAFENKASPSKPQKDPTEMSLKERMMLFEKNKGNALLPKAPFAMAPPINKIREDVKKAEDNFKKPKNDGVKDFPVSEVNVRNKVAALTAASSTISESSIKADILKKRQEDMEIIANRFNKQKNVERGNVVSKATGPPPPPPPMPSKYQESKKVTDIRMSGNNKRRSPGVGYSNSIESSENDDEDDSKRKRTNSLDKNGHRLYPNLSEFETDVDNDNYTTATVSVTSLDKKESTADEEEEEEQEEFDDSYMESEDSESARISNVSLGREIMRVVQANETQNSSRKTKTVRYADYNNETYCTNSSINSYNTSDGSIGIDDYLDEALDEDEGSEDEAGHLSETAHSQGTTSSNSFSYQRRPRKYSGGQTISEETDDYECTPMNVKSPVKSILSINPSKNNDVVTLTHTVSFYRRQQATNSNNSTPVRVIHREERQGFSEKQQETEEESNNVESDKDEQNLVKEKIEKLLDEVLKQEQVIAQTSQALNLCASTIEFSGSTESVEGERHLLVATHRRKAALDEVQRLSIERRLVPNNGSKEKGRLTVQEIIIPLKQDYIRKLSTDAISGHHLVCLLKYNEHVLATKTVPTLPGLLAVKFPDVLQVDVYEDFRAILEVYGMTAQREVLPHEVKYHINLNKKGGIKTPKKKGAESRLIMPPVQSPAGPNVVRTPALVQYGYAIFSLREVQRTTWSLTEASRVSPLDGNIHMKINCELTISTEYKGFLTMFEDISGFGAWHRRWCYLTGHVINYWKYPDDEKRKPPMGTIDLSTCCTPKVTTAPRDLCARLNTLLLECQRPAREDDVETHLVIPKGHITIQRYLLSADTREERDEWAAYINKTVSFLRAWGKAKQRE